MQRVQIHAHAGVNDAGNGQRNRNRKCGRNNVKDNRAHADFTKRLGIANRGRAADERAQNQRYDQHLHQTQEALSDHIEHAVDQNILYGVIGQHAVVQENAQNRAQQQRNKDTRCQADLFLLCLSHHRAPFSPK